MVIKCLVQYLMEFKHNSTLSRSIHNIGIDPFFVHYWTNYQMAVYNDLNKENTKLSIDAIGSLVKKLNERHWIYCQPTFFYMKVF
jgi:hypothetical protein